MDFIAYFGFRFLFVYRHLLLFDRIDMRHGIFRHGQNALGRPPLETH